MRHQTIFRNSRPDTGYTQVSTLLLNDASLSAEGLALAVSIISKPLFWDFNLAWARKRFGWGETKSEHVVRELIHRGFVRKNRHREEDGTLGPVVYEFTDVPHKFAENDHSAEITAWQNGTSVSTLHHAAENHSADSAAHIKDREVEKEKPLTPLEKGNSLAQTSNSEKSQPEQPPNSDDGGKVALQEDASTAPPSKSAKGPRITRQAAQVIPYSTALELEWKLYPDAVELARGSKLDAWRAWLDMGCEAISEEIHAATKVFAASRKAELERRGEYAPCIPHLATWLRAKGWEGVKVEVRVERPVYAPPKVLAEKKIVLTPEQRKLRADALRRGRPLAEVAGVCDA